MDRRLFLAFLASMPTALMARDALHIYDLCAEDSGLTEQAKALNGKTVTVGGLMHLPKPKGFLKRPENLFVLTVEPLPVRHIHAHQETYWVPGILPVLTEKAFQPSPAWKYTEVSGRLRLEPYRIFGTEFQSLMFLSQAKIS